MKSSRTTILFEVAKNYNTFLCLHYIRSDIVVQLRIRICDASLTFPIPLSNVTGDRPFPRAIRDRLVAESRPKQTHFFDLEYTEFWLKSTSGVTRETSAGIFTRYKSSPPPTGAGEIGFAKGRVATPVPTAKKMSSLLSTATLGGEVRNT